VSKRSARRFEQILKREGMPAELAAQPSWRCMPATAARRLVELPHDRDGWQWTLADRVYNFLSDAQHTPGYNARLEELYWRGDWSGYPKWHRALVFSHVNDDSGTSVADFARAKRMPYPQVWRALEHHKHRAGIGGEKMATPNGSTQASTQQASRVEQTQAVRVKVVFHDKLDMHLGLGNIKYAEGELVMGGRFVKIEFPPERPHPIHDHVLVPVGAGMTIAVLKD
jgi:hypothetical protein